MQVTEEVGETRFLLSIWVFMFYGIHSNCVSFKRTFFIRDLLYPKVICFLEFWCVLRLRFSKLFLLLVWTKVHREQLNCKWFSSESLLRLAIAHSISHLVFLEEWKWRENKNIKKREMANLILLCTTRLEMKKKTQRLKEEAMEYKGPSKANETKRTWWEEPEKTTKEK